MQTLESRTCYVALKAKDPRFDGRFFVGVSSTGIYCRPICRAKLPREENCTFYKTAAAAEQAGYRPCLLCRPELAPGLSTMDEATVLVYKAARLLEQGCASEQSIAEYAKRLGCSERHLRRIFAAEFQVSPVQYLQTCRLLLAKNLLTDTNISITDVAMGAGFGSLRRFNDLFKKQYCLTPSALRKQTSLTKRNDNNITLKLGYRPPYQWQRIIEFLAVRAIPNVEVVSNDSYMRTVNYIDDKNNIINGWIRVEHCPEKNALSVTLNSTLLPALPYLLTRIQNLFDLHCYPDAINETLTIMNKTKPDLYISGVRVPGCFEPFEMMVRAILGQQITVKAARTLTARFVEKFGATVDTGFDSLTKLFPRAQTIVELEGDISSHLGPLGIIKSRANTILCLAKMITDGEIDFTTCTDLEKMIKKLMSISGIGTWTAQYIAMRAMGWPDAFPHTDYGVKKALAPLTENEILQQAEAWRPWRSYATISLWNSL